MMEFQLCKDHAATFVIEGDAFSGVKKVLQKVKADIALVTDKEPGERSSLTGEDYEIFVGTLGKSVVLRELEESGKMDFSNIAGKRESFSFSLVELKGEGAKPTLVIAGSDKRGTIYGLFHISELLEVSPFVNFSDVKPKKLKQVVWNQDINFVSKEPSVKYRGFFINDEWPAFGNWTFEHFGGFTAQMYDSIFELLLRMKGNYLWPAMWTSSFTLDGPGEANAILADEYGVVMSNSHHEPCLRHSEEWDIVRGPKTKYGNEWNYATNRDGLLEYWRGGLLRSGKYENVITIGMRGERDSTMLGEDATLKENIDLLKDIITEQRKLIAECVVPQWQERMEEETKESIGALAQKKELTEKDIPEMIALYKEVEAYFYGNPGARDGLRDWDGLDGVTFMLCEDNFGNMRTLPTPELKNREGGWGMYYHFDYHGGPISYEWVNSSYIPKVWDQMSEAYELGIRDIWIVNVGDVKFQEYPLGFFMNLAYDYESWGAHNLNAPKEYVKSFCKQNFAGQFSEEDMGILEEVMVGYTKLSHNRKPEAMNPSIYHPTHFNEAEKTLKTALDLEEKLEHLRAVVGDEDPVKEAAFWELVYYPAKGTLNVQKWNLYGTMNAFYAKYGATIANYYVGKMSEAKVCDQELTAYFHKLLDGKWNGMGLSKHVCFSNWNDEESRFPARSLVDPIPGARIFAYVKGDGDVVTAGGDWTRRKLVAKNFCQPKNKYASIVLMNGGSDNTNYEVSAKGSGLLFAKLEAGKDYADLEWKESLTSQIGIWNEIEEVVVKRQEETVTSSYFEIRFQGGHIDVEVPGLLVSEKLPENTHVWNGRYISIEAEHTCKKDDALRIYEGYGKTLSALKAYPIDAFYEMEQAPKATYRLWVPEEGKYQLYVYAAPINPTWPEADMSVGVTTNGKDSTKISLIPDNYVAGEPSCPSWAKMVLDQIRIVSTEIALCAGVNEVAISSLCPGFALEKLVVARDEKSIPESYLGPEETYFERGDK